MRKQLIGLTGMVAWLSMTWAGPMPMTVEMHRSEIDFGAGCYVAMNRPKGSDGAKAFVVEPVPRSWKSNMGEMRFFVSCYDKGDEAISKGAIARFDVSQNKWIKDIANAYQANAISEKGMEEINAVSEVKNIESVNSTGYAAVTSDTVGDESRRVKTMTFCLFHLAKALCGSGTVAYLADGRKGDLTKHTLEMIRSIKFLDATAPTLGR